VFVKCQNESLTTQLENEMTSQDMYMFLLFSRLNAIPHKYVTKVQYAHKFHAVVEYANSKPWEELDLSQYYQECRNKARSTNYTFVGD
jgi:uncharacterized protein (DUF927 family)